MRLYRCRWSIHSGSACCKNARKLKEITYDENAGISNFGAKVLHNRSVEMAKKYGVQLVVRSSLNLEEGTTCEGGSEDGENVDQWGSRG